ncbi:MAG: 1,6-anhydro-N-acetylmuramyl-L-alanine amidase AmpD [Pseudomonadota bacterium]
MDFKVDFESGRLLPARLSLSPHCDFRPVESSIDLLVIHNISLPPGIFGKSYIEDLFLGRLSIAEHPYFEHIATAKVSAHLLIRRDGEVIQFVPFNQRAWHAGQSSFHGRSACNDFSIGIELEGTDDLDFEAIQYQQLADITRHLMQVYPKITPETIVGHSDIAPGRKTDPGPHFDWARYYGLIGISK